MSEVASTVLEFDREVDIGGALGIKVRVSGQCGPAEFKRVGEAVAGQRRARAPEVWVWVYGHDMDLEGPSVCVSYTSTEEEPITEFIDPKAVRAWYSGKMLAHAPSGEVH